MKKILLCGCGGTLVFCAISTSPDWLLRLLLSAAAFLALLHELGRHAPIGYEDENGFHYSNRPRTRRHAHPRRGALAGSLFPPARSAAKA